MRVAVGLLLLAFLVGASMAETLRGTSPEFEKMLATSSSIKCDGGKKTIKLEYVNDDYCDCEDGTDEPGTSACANAKFYCRNIGHLPLTIPAQWVDDGHCDCCDGSDEISAKCPNTCAAAAAEYNKRVMEQASTVEAGLRVRSRYIENAKRAKETKRARLTELENNVLPTAEARVKELEAEKERADNELKVLQDEVDAVKHAREEAARIKREEAEAAANDQAQQNEDPEAEYERNNAHHPETETKSDPSLPDPEDDPEYKKARETESAGLFSGLLDTVTNLIKKPFTAVESFRKENERDSLEAALTEARSTRDAAKREVDEINKFFTLDFGPEDAFYGNYGETYEYTTHEYTYELKMFQSVYQKQSGRQTRMGDWEAWKAADKSSQMYSKGEHCWGGPDRSCKVIIKCGPEPRVLDVKEPAKCEYEMQFETPAACSPDMIKTL